MKKYIYYVLGLITIISNTDGTISFINRIKQSNMTIQDVGVILRIIVTFAVLSFIAWMYFNFKAKFLALKRYNEERFNITIKSIKTYFQENFKEHDDLATIISEIKPEYKIKEGKDTRIDELWDKIKKDFEAVQKQYDKEFENWTKE
jgi:hypothetical protein